MQKYDPTCIGDVLVNGMVSIYNVILIYYICYLVKECNKKNVVVDLTREMVETTKKMTDVMCTYKRTLTHKYRHVHETTQIVAIAGPFQY